MGAARRLDSTITAPRVSRLLEHCAGLAHVTDDRRESARTRLERELGDDLADLLVQALAHEGGEERRFDALS